MPLEKASEIAESKKLVFDESTKETLKWIANFAWNYAIDSAKLYIYETSLKLFEVSGKIYGSLLTRDNFPIPELLAKVKMSYIMSSSICLELLRITPENQEKYV